VIFKRVLGMMAAVAALATAAGVCVVALAYTLFASLRDQIGPAWAAAAVAGAAAVLALICAFLLTRKAKPPKPVKGDDQNLAGRLIDLARERPLVAAGAMAAALAVVIKNPRILTAVATAALASRTARPPRR